MSAGTKLTYTLTFKDTGTGPFVVDYTDLLSGVLDDAAVTAQPVASDGARGDDLLENFVFPTGAQPPATCVTGDPLCTSNPVTTPAGLANTGPLAYTGANVTGPVMLALLILLGGAALLIIRNRKATK